MGERILVVDDVNANRYVIGRWLEHSGYDVIEAASGGEALAAVREQSPDLVLLDVRMPDMDGFEVCERIKADPATAAVPVIHLTASAVDVRDRTQGLSRGADGYLTEPVEPEVLLATVQATLRYASARRRAERLAGQLAAMADTTLAVNSTGSVPEVVAAAARGAALMFGCAVTVLATALNGPHVHVAAVGADGEQARVSVERAVFGEAAHGLTMLTGPGSDWAPLLDPSARDGEVRVALARLQARPLVAVLVPADATASEADLHVLSQLSQTVALAVQGLRSLDEERRIALTLQRSLLPRSLPDVPGLKLAARYVPASTEAEIGGDFYEVIQLGDRLLVAVGDAMGHSLHAATVMAEIRHAVRAYASEGHSPGEILRRVNRLMLDFLPRELATVVLLLVDPATGELLMCNAGHLPPLLVTGGHAEYVILPGPLLGADLPRPDETRLTLPPGGALVLVTDGLIEHRDLGVSDGLDRLRELSTPVDPDLEAFCDRLLTGLMRPGHEDDVALVVLRRT
ncbi:hypothetical protein Aph01nite_21550 [Acrocarpospora phusangensis]|uniref:Response regulatory domain-containing protein n=1 Tax=Acrocarpospora phusangensis TaxID=1070424 RepID=A0A919QBZ4_9ACTN|nr:fused response regulator/phosphatase [Acrocarpospora phusangensis]GIH23845.1 hypothetical protein Aph01nite_21550 [Acrocarpospora phusangensis]